MKSNPEQITDLRPVATPITPSQLRADAEKESRAAAEHAARAADLQAKIAAHDAEVNRRETLINGMKNAAQRGRDMEVQHAAAAKSSRETAIELMLSGHANPNALRNTMTFARDEAYCSEQAGKIADEWDTRAAAAQKELEAFLNSDASETAVDLIGEKIREDCRFRATLNAPTSRDNPDEAVITKLENELLAAHRLRPLPKDSSLLTRALSAVGLGNK